MVVETFDMVHFVVEMTLVASLIYITIFAMRKFKIVIWKKGFYAFIVGTVLLAVHSIFEFLIAQGYFLGNTAVLMLTRSTHFLIFACFVAGIAMLAKSAGKLWGKL